MADKQPQPSDYAEVFDQLRRQLESELKGTKDQEAAFKRNLEACGSTADNQTADDKLPLFRARLPHIAHSMRSNSWLKKGELVPKDLIREPARAAKLRRDLGAPDFESFKLKPIAQRAQGVLESAYDAGLITLPTDLARALRHRKELGAPSWADIVDMILQPTNACSAGRSDDPWAFVTRSIAALGKLASSGKQEEQESPTDPLALKPANTANANPADTPIVPSQPRPQLPSSTGGHQPPPPNWTRELFLYEIADALGPDYRVARRRLGKAIVKLGRQRHRVDYSQITEPEYAEKLRKYLNANPEMPKKASGNTSTHR